MTQKVNILGFDVKIFLIKIVWIRKARYQFNGSISRMKNEI